jgi:hypothetical protein
MSPRASRCDQIIALIDACLAEVDTPATNAGALSGAAVGTAPDQHIVQASPRAIPDGQDRRRASDARRHRHNRQLLRGMTVVAAPSGSQSAPEEQRDARHG